MRAKSTESSYHHNQFLTMFEILFHLTEDGFEEVESVRKEQRAELSQSNMADFWYEPILILDFRCFQVLRAVFSYLKLLRSRGPQKRIFKELQRLQAIDFHSLGQSIDEVAVLRGAKDQSKALHFVVSRDIVTAPNIMVEYNGNLLSDLLQRFEPGNVNVMIISNQHPPEDITKKETFLGTMFGISGKYPDPNSTHQSGFY
jgi:hypothetical protein